MNVERIGALKIGLSLDRAQSNIKIGTSIKPKH